MLKICNLNYFFVQASRNPPIGNSSSFASFRLTFPNLVTPKINLNNFFDTIQFNVCVLLACLRFWRQKSQFCREILCTMDQEIERSQFLRFDFLPSFLHTHSLSLSLCLSLSLSLLLPLSLSPSQAAVDWNKYECGSFPGLVEPRRFFSFPISNVATTQVTTLLIDEKTSRKIKKYQCLDLRSMQ